MSRALSGGVYISSALSEILSEGRTPPADRTKESDAPINRLSDREMEIIELTGSGVGTKKIAEILNLSVKTVETHKVHIQNKLNLSGSAELRRFAIEWRNGLKTL